MSGTIEVSALPNNTSIGTTTQLVSTNGSGTGGLLIPLETGINDGILLQSTSSTISSSDSLVTVQGGTTKLAPASALSAGVTKVVAGAGLAGGTITSSGTISFTFPGAGIPLSSGSAWESLTIGSGLALSGTTLSATGGAGSVTEVVAGAGLTGGTITSSGTIAISFPAAGLVQSTGSAFSDVTIGANLTLFGGTLTAGGAWEITDGTHSVSNVETLTVTGGTISGSGGNATLAITGGGGGGITAGPIFGTTTTFSRPSLSDFTQVPSPAGTVTEISGGPIFFHGGPSGSQNFFEQEVSGTFTLTAMVEPQLTGSGQVGIFVTDDYNVAVSPAHFVIFNLVLGQTNNLFVQQYTGAEGFEEVVYDTNTNNYGPIWLQIVYDGTNLIFNFSSNGIVFTLFNQVAVSATNLTGVVACGWCVYCNVAFGDSGASLWQYTLVT